jgi:hypothetical protein
MRRLWAVALVVALAGCGGSPTEPDPPPSVAGAWDWFQVVPRQGGGFNENPTGFVLLLQQTGGSLTATVAAPNDPQVLASGTGSVTAPNGFTLQLVIPQATCNFSGTVESATSITGTQTCPTNGFTVGFAFRKR